MHYCRSARACEALAAPLIVSLVVPLMMTESQAQTEQAYLKLNTSPVSAVLLLLGGWCLIVAVTTGIGVAACRSQIKKADAASVTVGLIVVCAADGFWYVRPRFFGPTNIEGTTLGMLTAVTLAYLALLMWRLRLLARQSKAEAT